ILISWQRSPTGSSSAKCLSASRNLRLRCAGSVSQDGRRARRIELVIDQLDGTITFDPDLRRAVTARRAIFDSHARRAADADAAASVVLRRQANQVGPPHVIVAIHAVDTEPAKCDIFNNDVMHLVERDTALLAAAGKVVVLR